MRAWIRICLLSLLALALPFQGWAAAAMTGCAARHAAAAPVAGSVEAHDHAAHHTVMPVASDVAATPSPHGPLHGASHAAADCPVCAACCMLAALLPSTTGGPLPLPQATPAVRDAVGMPLHLTGGPDRPPRPSA